MKKRTSRKNFVNAIVFFLCFMIALPLASSGGNFDDTGVTDYAKVLYFLGLDQEQDWQGNISITNLESKDSEIKLEAYDRDGNLLETVGSVKIGADEAKEIDLQIFPSDTASLKMESETVVASSVVFTKNGERVFEIPASNEPSQQLDFPLSDNKDAFEICMLNPNNVRAEVNIIALDKDGNELQNSFLQSLSPMESSVVFLTDIFNTIKNLSIIRIESDSNIIGIQLDIQTNGTRRKSARSGYDAAWSFRYPLDYMPTPTQNFGTWNSKWQGYHLGEDYKTSSEAPVHAVSNGYVAHVNNHTGYGYVVVVEHTLPDGNQICSVYGHMRKADIITQGTNVTKGQRLGYLSSNSSENGGYNFTHLHWGIRSGAYSSSYDSDGRWRYRGYGPASVKNLWYDPTDFASIRNNGLSSTVPIISPSTPVARKDFSISNTITNGYSYAGSFSFRLIVKNSSGTRVYTSPIEIRWLNQNYSVTLYFSTSLSSIGSYSAFVEFMAPGTTRWWEVAGSNESFQVNQQNLKLISPNGREQWDTGKNYTIMWDTGSAHNYVRILLYKGENWFQTIAVKTDNNGSYSWTIPNSLPEGNDYKIRIADYSTGFLDDYSDEFFSIVNRNTDNLFLQNETITALESYNANNSIQTGREVTDTKPYGNFVIESGADVTMRANTIYLKAGFQAKEGCKFHAIAE
ncbi:MAG: peptidoglycan DD-metalloendopeptidase family protein [Desulfobacterales bacterium]|nr:peptidoglycan DD-metalloendopeptidase family protein [Desulfobacterales bacterium]